MVRVSDPLECIPNDICYSLGALRTGGAAVILHLLKFLALSLTLHPKLHEPYHDNPDTNGVMRLSSEVLNGVVPRFLSDGWQVVRHMGFLLISNLSQSS